MCVYNYFGLYLNMFLEVFILLVDINMCKNDFITGFTMLL